MPQEIERKFLVQDGWRTESHRQTRIVQGYLSSVPGRSVRVRIAGEQGYLTIKGAANGSGVSRYEWEREIPVDEAEALLALAEPGVIEKIRHLVAAGPHTFELDEFFGDNAGLVVAEIELGAEDETFERPPWLGMEVTGDRRYYNSSLVKQPYRSFAEAPIAASHSTRHLLAISGSLRGASSNTTALRALAALAPAGVTIHLYDELDALPHFNPDLDGADDLPPPAVARLRALVAGADGLLISTPEYAHGLPGSLKNALDWLVSSTDFPGKPVAILNISPRSEFAHASLAEILRTMSATLVTDPALTVPLPHKRFTPASLLADAPLAARLGEALTAFLAALRRSTG